MRSIMKNILDINFLKPINLLGIGITDLFEPNDGIDNPGGELGRALVSFFNTTTTSEYFFYGNNSDQGNGEQYIDFEWSLD